MNTISLEYAVDSISHHWDGWELVKETETHFHFNTWLDEVENGEEVRTHEGLTLINKLTGEEEEI